MEPIPPRAFERLVGDALDTLPAPLGELMENVAIVVEDQHPTEDLLGLYEGIPLTEKSVMDTPMGPDIVWLFREPILEEWRDRDGVSLADLVAHVTIHEFAHHFGWSDDDIAAIDPWWE